MADRRCQIPNFIENSVQVEQEEDDDHDDDEDEALSLSDLPLIHQPRKNREEEDQGEEIEAEEFDFCSFSKESEMCAADEVFFQGQILPLRHSISSDKGSLQYSSRSVSRSESMDHYYSARLISSRSSSTSSGSSSATGGHHHRNSKPGLPPRNQFHSHPSPSPRLSFSNQRTIASNRRNSVGKSSVWNILRLGLVTTPPEIALHDLKIRGGTNCRNFGSRNSTSSNGSSVSSTKSKKKKARGLLGGCKCSMDAVDTVAIMKRSASENDVERGRENVEDEIKPQKLKKKHLSHHRTFEWLKQLSVEGTTDES